MTFNHSATTRR